MSYKTIVPKPISRAINLLHLPRDVMVQLLGRLHEEIPRQYQHFRANRVEGAEELYACHLTVTGETRHLFFLTVDDTTAQGYLIVTSLAYQRLEG